MLSKIDDLTNFNIFFIPNAFRNPNKQFMYSSEVGAALVYSGEFEDHCTETIFKGGGGMVCTHYLDQLNGEFSLIF